MDQASHDADARGLVDLYDAKWAIVHENAQRPTDGPGRLMGAHIDAALDAGKRQDEACEAFRRKYYPRAGRVIVGLRMVSVLSPKGRRGRIVYEPQRVTA